MLNAEPEDIDKGNWNRFVAGVFEPFRTPWEVPEILEIGPWRSFGSLSGSFETLNSPSFTSFSPRIISQDHSDHEVIWLCTPIRFQNLIMLQNYPREVELISFPKWRSTHSEPQWISLVLCWIAPSTNEKSSLFAADPQDIRFKAISESLIMLQGRYTARPKERPAFFDPVSKLLQRSRFLNITAIQHAVWDWTWYQCYLTRYWPRMNLVYE